MEEYVRSYAGLRLERAREELQTAEENIANGRFRAAVSRCYYAMFYMASAALFSQSVQRSKHSGVESAFAEHLIKSGQIETEYSRSYQRVRRLREEADYAERVEIDEMTARQSLVEAKGFVTRVEKFLIEVEIL